MIGIVRDRDTKCLSNESVLSAQFDDYDIYIYIERER